MGRCPPRWNEGATPMISIGHLGRLNDREVRWRKKASTTTMGLPPPPLQNAISTSIRTIIGSEWRRSLRRNAKKHIPSSLSVLVLYGLPLSFLMCAFSLFSRGMARPSLTQSLTGGWARPPQTPILRPPPAHSDITLGVCAEATLGVFGGAIPASPPLPPYGQ